jgi:hypothetical protein
LHISSAVRKPGPELPRRKVTARAIGKTYTRADGMTYQPSMFITLMCPRPRPYRRGRKTPADPSAHDYGQAPRDALHFAALFGRQAQAKHDQMRSYVDGSGGTRDLQEHVNAILRLYPSLAVRRIYAVDPVFGCRMTPWGS